MRLVIPGETFTVKEWKMDEGKDTVQTATQDGRVVVENALPKIV
jgi:hypothetical protein